MNKLQGANSFSNVKKIDDALDTPTTSNKKDVTQVTAFGGTKNEVKTETVAKSAPMEQTEPVASKAESFESNTVIHSSPIACLAESIENNDDALVEEHIMEPDAVMAVTEPILDESVAQHKPDVSKDYKEDSVNKMLNQIDQINEHPIKSLVTVGSCIKSSLSSIFRRWSISRMSRKSKVLVKSGKFEFLRSGNSFIAYKYRSTDSVVEIPAYVGGLPVQYIHSDFFYNRINPFDSYEFRAAKEMITGDSIDALENFGDDGIGTKITKVILPNTITMVAGPVFDFCLELKELVVPASVRVFEYNAVKGSGIERIYFNGGSVPKGFLIDKFNGDVFVKIEDKNVSSGGE